MKAVIIGANILIVFSIVIQIILRVVFDSSIFGFNEIAKISGSWLYLIGAAYCTKERTHIKASFVHVIFKSQKAQRIIKAIATFITIVIVLMLDRWAYIYFFYGLNNPSFTPALNIQYSIPQSALFFGSILMTIYFIAEFIGDLKNIKNNEA